MENTATEEDHVLLVDDAEVEAKQQQKKDSRVVQIVKALVVVLLVVIVITALVVFFLPHSPLKRAVLRVLLFVERSNKIIGSFCLVATDVVIILFCLPGTAIDLSSGFLYHLPLGSCVAVSGTFLGAMCSFVLGRTLLRNWVRAKAEKHPKFKAIDQAVADKGFLIIALLRLTPLVPFGVCSWILAATGVSPLVYATASFVGLVPSTMGYVYLGTLLRSLQSIFQPTSTSSSEMDPHDKHVRLVKTIVYMVCATVLTLALIIVVGFITGKALKKAMKEERMEGGVAQPLLMETSDSPATTAR